MKTIFGILTDSQCLQFFQLCFMVSDHFDSYGSSRVNTVISGFHSFQGF